MSNDLLFPILPRNTKVPVEEDKRVKKVEKSKRSEHVDHEERDQFDEVKHAEVLAHMAKREKTNNRKSDEEATKTPKRKHIDVDV
ncbi:hypothetical protein GTH32_12315 [Alteromonas sp. 345S023]|uniref:Uncharacterized protein n=1 Tax=Alteromonas profundi TaxID=2696062 RepID=A0A7X5LMA6_9ALTE|nr:hypothetical protein [Alteromonas profundi]NDV91962.1 hypothetical protein [Alteromonas profundi]